MQMENNFETEADKLIAEALSSEPRKSFFLFAGAGAGKTRSLVNTLEYIENSIGDSLRQKNKRVAVISFTNAAAEEIKNRTQHNSLFAISTIHSFAWDLIKGLDFDIREALKAYLYKKIDEYNSKSRRSGTSAEITHEKRVKRLAELDTIKHFQYEPNQNVPIVDKDYLTHSEVLFICSYLLKNKPLMEIILVNRFPILLIDESQDTDKELMETMLGVQQNHANKFIIGLFGDTKQRIYNGGKEDLGETNWNAKGFVTPLKPQNHRSGKRIIELANKIGEKIDSTPPQIPVDQNNPGIVRLFICPTTSDKAQIEQKIREKMAEITRDSLWIKTPWEDKDGAMLVLEHRMAAVRLGFVEMWDSLKNLKEFDSIKDGTSSEINYFANFIMPLIHTDNPFEIANITKKHNKSLFEKADKETLEKIKNSVNGIRDAYKQNPNITFGDMLKVIKDTDLFDVPRKYDEEYEFYAEFLDTKLAQIIPYSKYVNEVSGFNTHHGVKGLEFQHVMAIIDNDSKWKAYNYTSCFTGGVANAATLRLLYVICTRAKKSLALVLYADIEKCSVDNSLFYDDEIIMLN